MSPRIFVADGLALASALASDFEAEGQRAINAHGRFCIALPGGSVASSVFPSLARLRFDWSRTEFFWVDERAVAPSEPESNYALARSMWLEPAGVPEERVHRMPAHEADLHHAARAYADELRHVIGDPPRLDFALLGVGADGHIASLFPGHPSSTDERDLVTVVEDAPKPPPRRLTLTMPVLVSSERVVIVATGRAKANVIHDLLEHPESPLPVAVVVRRSRRSLLLLDRDAASNSTHP